MMRDGYRKARLALALAVATMSFGTLAGCGGGSGQPTTAVLNLESSGVQANGELTPDTRCGWGSLWVPLEWGAVPEDTKELAILLARFKYVKREGTRKPMVVFSDLVSKFKPTERKLVANVLPEGVSWSYFGTNCVPGLKGQRLLLAVFALDRVRNRKIDRRLATRLTEEALADPNPTDGPRSPGELTADATAVGRLITTNYTGPH